MNLLEIMLDPLSRALADAPFDDELPDDDQTRDVAASKAWLKNNRGIPNHEVLAELGLSPDDFEAMGKSPLPSESQDSKH